MVDIHTHILPFMDDGSNSLEKSIEMLKKSAELGVTDLVLTPHYRYDYRHGKLEIQKAFSELKEAVEQTQIKINLYLGQELLIDRNFKQFVSSGELITLNETKYLLIEFDLGSRENIIDPVYELVRLGYTPIIAHFERYFYADLELAYQVKSLGGLIQVNAASVVGRNSHKIKKLAKLLLKNDLVDFVASDVHCFRENLMAKSYAHVLKKYGKELVNKIYIENAQKIIGG